MKKTLKTIIALMLALTMLLSFAACTSEKEKDDAGISDDLVTDGNVDPNEDGDAEGGDTDEPSDDASAPSDDEGEKDPEESDAPAASVSDNPPASSSDPSAVPSSKPSTAPSAKPSTEPSQEPSQEPSTEPSADTSTELALSELMESILADVMDLPGYEMLDVTEERFIGFLGIDYVDGYEAVSADALISPVAHSVVLLRVPEGTDVAAVAASVEANANVNKWICAFAEIKIVKYHENTILLVMSYEGTAEAIAENFDNIYA